MDSRSRRTIFNVFTQNKVNIKDKVYNNLELIAENIYDELAQAQKDFDRIASAALDSSCDMEEQTNGAHQEIHDILVEQGTLSA